MSQRWGRFTVRGSEAVEAALESLVGQVAEAVRTQIPGPGLVALVLIGGYGRGEGGIEVVGGIERPHNNLDFLLITRSPSEDLQRRIDAALDPLRERNGLGMDLSLISPWKLRHSPPLLLWYDMRFGHKTLLGDAAFVPGLARFTAERILPSDVRNLLVNRATLLLINRLLLRRDTPSESMRRTVIKHAIKCIIGYGDALLFFKGDYHWSYQEKQRRMRTRSGIPETFRRLYDDAMEFRFQPVYAPHLGKDLDGWMDELSILLGPIHLECERLRLWSPDLAWDDYLPAGLRNGLWEEPLSPRAWARKLRNLAASHAPPRPPGIPSSLGLRCCGWRGVLPLLLPAVAFPTHAPIYEGMAAVILGSAPGPGGALDTRYLRLWGEYCDSNFHKAIQALNVQLND